MDGRRQLAATAYSQIRMALDACNRALDNLPFEDADLVDLTYSVRQLAKAQEWLTGAAGLLGKLQETGPLE